MLQLDPFIDEARLINRLAIVADEHRQFLERIELRRAGIVVPRNFGDQFERDVLFGKLNSNLARVRTGCRADQAVQSSLPCRCELPPMLGAVVPFANDFLYLARGVSAAAAP